MIEIAGSPFTIFDDPADVSRMQSAVNSAWSVLHGEVPDALQYREAQRLTFIVVSLAMSILDDKELVLRAVERFRRPSKSRSLL